MNKPNQSSYIKKNMNILDILDKYPETLNIFRDHGLGCIGCRLARYETIEQGLLAHEYDVESFIGLLNEKIGQEMQSKNTN